MKFSKEQITHIGIFENGATTYMRKNKCGQWNVLILDRKGYRWDMLNYLNYPKSIYGVTQQDLEDFVYYTNSDMCSSISSEINQQIVYLKNLINDLEI